MHYFFSDVHLGLGSAASSRERERQLVRFLEMVGGAGAESLWIVGDLFDYWFDYRTAIPSGFVRTLGAIASLVDAGVKVEYVIGNHDFGHYRFFAEELGVAVHTEDVEREIAGRRCYISHGDGKAFNDAGYRVLRSVLRNPVSGALWRLLHPDLGIGVAAWASRRSRQHTQSKDYSDRARQGEADGLAAFARRKIVEQGVELVVMGHNHLPAQVQHAGGTYVNLGTWLDDRPYLKLDADGFELARFDCDRHGGAAP